MDQSNRTRVFLSHANPHDNILTAWLGSRLAAAGYQVWSDLDCLRGGERIWPTIQSAIRDETSKFIFLGSRKSAESTGVLNEVHEALSTGKRLGDPNFVLPIKTDDLPWDDFPIQVKPIAGIDFHGDWPGGFNTLLGVLARDNVPRDASSSELLRIADLYIDAQRSLSHQPETLVSNWLPILELPVKLYAYRSRLSAMDLRAGKDRVSFPSEAHGRLLLTFAEPEFVKVNVPVELGLDPAYEMELTEFLSGRPPNAPEFGPEAGKMGNSIVRQAWEGFAVRAGLYAAGDPPKWFVPEGWVVGEKAHYVDFNGKRAWRQLEGKAKDLRWHYAVSARPRLYEPRVLQLTPHVIFSADGSHPLADQKGLRRRHCKLWWNDKWRDLMLAFLARLFGPDATSGAIPLGGQAVLKVGARPTSFTLPMSYVANDSHLPTEEEAELLDRDDADDEVAP